MSRAGSGPRGVRGSFLWGDHNEREDMGTGSIKLVNNTGANIEMFDSVLLAAVSANRLPEELKDIFVLTILSGFNEDGSDRGILTMA